METALAPGDWVTEVPNTSSAKTEFVESLKERPGQWRVWRTDAKDHNHVTAFNKMNGVEAASRNGVVYVRWTGTLDIN